MRPYFRTFISRKVCFSQTTSVIDERIDEIEEKKQKKKHKAKILISPRKNNENVARRAFAIDLLLYFAA